ncbi:NAD(P)/FAD-dependent oxidoreductase [Desulfobotulus sp. H1]|uniref:NADH:ubiquinone reductase (non-electrogenic) n=1 Tax=Desulfobotulus pelophilus TaxID=2823377 RepID=A0ABT3NB39_9BACT|nr:NAD(P)/FAD-dependent oxidoreductase [Desulfobotulus pelophilus]MCW7754676.1 NAD(P)/FAD-dependent oxidoreductase [Desulfobotulus pelophilus]
MKHVLIVGGGFVGLNAAKILGRSGKLDVTLIDRKNYHLFQPLLYQVAMAGLSPAEIAAPLRALLSGYRNVRVLQAEALSIDMETRKVVTTVGPIHYDYLVLGCGAQHTYFGNEVWEPLAPGLKTIEQATEIRRRILYAFERAECTDNTEEKMKQLTFVVVGGGTTGVELSGAIGEMSRYTFSKDFKNIDPTLTRVILVEAGDRILPGYHPDLSAKATRDLEALGVQVWTSRRVTSIDSDGVDIGKERVQAATVIWAAGIQASDINGFLGQNMDDLGRVPVRPDLSIGGHPEIFAGGDQAAFIPDGAEWALPGVAPVALQQGRHIAKNILMDMAGKPRRDFTYLDKGQMATIGRSRAVVEVGKIRFSGFFAWMTWLLIHIYFLTGFKNRLFVVLQWAGAYFTFNRGARLIVNKEWQFYAPPKKKKKEPVPSE